MALQKFQASDFSGKTINELSNTPNADGMTGSQLRLRFDAMTQQTVDLLNTRVMDALTSTLDSQSGADQIGATAISGTGDNATVQSILEALASLISGHTTDISTLISNVTYDSSTGTFTFTRFNGSSPVIVDTPLEKVVTNFTYVNTEEHPQCLRLDYGEGASPRYEYVSLASFVDEYDFDSSGTVKFTVSNHKVKADVDPTYMATINQAVTDAQASATNAGLSETSASNSATSASNSATSALTNAGVATTKAEEASTSASTSEENKYASEGWALGKRNGTTIVDPTSPYYHNNAYYWASQAQEIVGTKVNSIGGASGTITLGNGLGVSGQQLSNTSYIYVGTSAPTDTNFWIDTN